jgi:carbon monoxide dehydrogenase subunit G
MNVTQIASALSNTVQNDQLLLNQATLQSLQDSAIAALRLDLLLNVLEVEGLTVSKPQITTTDNGVSIVGDVNVLGADVSLEVVFQQLEAGIRLNFSVKSLPTCHVPGASWLTLQRGQLALQVDAATVAGSIGGSIQTGDSEIAVTLLVGQNDGEFVLEWKIAEITLAAIAAIFLDGASMPPELPNLAFKDVDTVIKPKSRTFSFQTSSAAPLNFPANGNGFSITQTQISVARVAVEASNQINCAIDISGNQPLKIAEELVLNHYQLDLKLVGHDWTVTGDVEADIFTTALMLNAEYHQTPEEKHVQLSLAANPAITLINLDSTGQLSVAKLAVDLLQQTESKTESQSAWSVAATGAIALTDVVDVNGTLTLAKQIDNTVSLVFQPDHALVNIKLPPDKTAAMDLSFGDVSIIRQPSADRERKADWRFEAAVDVSFSGWHPTVLHYLPSTIATKFNADRNGVQLIADRVVNPFDFALPKIEVGDASVELGNASIDVSDLFIQLGKEIAIAAQLGIGLPSKLNNLFGTNGDGTPKLEFFNTLNPSDRDHSVVKAELRIGTAGIHVVPTSSIIRAISLTNEQGQPLQPGDDPWWLCDLKEFGAVKFKVPTFSYDTKSSSFAASGAFDTVRPLSLPMTLVKQLLSACKLQGAADALPAGLPLKGVEIVDSQGNFKVDELFKVLGALGTSLSSDVKDAIGLIGHQLDKLPDSFKQYLNIEIPQSFAFDIAVTPEGTVRFDASVKEGDPAIKVLIPGLLGAVPVLNGIQLRRLSFGELAGGSLFLLQVDATLDQFDLVTLATSVALPDLPTHLLPSTRTLHRRLVLNDLFMVIVYQTVIPIPIPLFYNEVGIEYLGLEGVELGAHAQFPMPTLNLVEAGKLLSSFKRFFSDRNYLLDPNAAPQTMNLKFSLKKNFLQLPPYLAPSTALLGDRQSGPEINAYTSLAQLLNGMKTLSVNQLIQAMPIEQRVNSTAIAFGPFSGSLGWFVTTPDEFRQIATQPQVKAQAYQRLGLTTDAQASGMLSVLPPVPAGAGNEQGLVTFLRGTCAITNLASFETTFGLAASKSLGFNTGFRMVGNVSDGMELGMNGRVVVPGQAGSHRAASDPAFQLTGQSYISFMSQRIFQGNVQISDRRFLCQGTLDLYGLGGSVMLAIDRDQGADLRGDLNPINLDVFKLTGAGGKPNPNVAIQIRPNQVPAMALSGAVQLLGIRSETQINISDRGFQFTTTGKLFNTFSCSLTASGSRLNTTANFRVAATMQSDLHQLLKTEATKVIQQAVSDAQTKISAQQKQVDDAQAKVTSLNQQIDQQRAIVQGERNSANQGLINARAKVNDAQNTVNSLNRQIDDKKHEISSTPKYRIDRLTQLGIELAGLYTALKGATEALKAAQAFLDKVAARIVNTPIDLDPRVSSLIASRDTASTVLNGYKQTLEVTKRGLGAVGVASDFITRRGLDALLIVTAASFDADLNTASGGQVTMAISLTYQDKPTNLSMNFNFNDAIGSAKALGQRLLSM